MQEMKKKVGIIPCNSVIQHLYGRINADPLHEQEVARKLGLVAFPGSLGNTHAKPAYSGLRQVLAFIRGRKNLVFFFVNIFTKSLEISPDGGVIYRCH